MLTNFKYYAGLLDSDGSIGLSPRKRTDGTFTVNASVMFNFAKRNGDVVLPTLADKYGVSISESLSHGKYPQSRLCLYGNKATMFLQEVGKHTVIKKDMAEWACKAQGRVVSEDGLKTLRAELSALRKDRKASDKNFPSRQWLAGYVDGDGCIESCYNRQTGQLAFRLSIATHSDDPQGVELVQGKFGGSIRQASTNGKVLLIRLSQRGESERVLGYFHKHLKIKRAQADLVRGILKDGRHLKGNGATNLSNLALHQNMQRLKNPQRLNDSTPKGEVIV